MDPFFLFPIRIWWSNSLVFPKLGAYIKLAEAMR
jgi:hypothetical protein